MAKRTCTPSGIAHPKTSYRAGGGLHTARPLGALPPGDFPWCYSPPTSSAI